MEKLLIVSPLLIIIVILLTNPRRFIFMFIVIAPIINIFWFFKIYDLTIVDIFSGLFPGFFIIILLNISRDEWWTWGRYSKYFLFMLLACLIPIVMFTMKGEKPLYCIEFFMKLLCGYGSYLMVLNLFVIEDLKIFLKSTIVAVLFTLILVVFQLLTGIGIEEERYILHGGIFYYDPGQYTRMALIGIAIVVPLLRFTTSKSEYFMYISILLLCAVTLAVSICRNVVLAAFTVLLVYSFMWRKFMISSLIIIFGFGLYFTVPIIHETFGDKIHNEVAYLSGEDMVIDRLGSGRVGIWKRSIEGFKERDLIEKLFGTGVGIGPHGQIFDLLKCVGIFGLVITVIFYTKLLIDSFWSVWHDKDSLPATYSFLFVILIAIMCFASSPLHNFYLQIIFFAFIALLEIQSKVSKNESQTEYEYSSDLPIERV